MENQPLIYGKMIQAIRAFGDCGIQKKDRNSFQKFDYRSIDSTLAAANAVFAEIGLVPVISCSEGRIERHTVAKSVATTTETVHEGPTPDSDFAGCNLRHTETATNPGDHRIDYSMFGLWTIRIYAEDGSFVEYKDIPAGNTTQDDSKLLGQVTSYLLKEVLFKNLLIPTVGNKDVDSMDEMRNQPPLVATPSRKAGLKSLKPETPPAAAQPAASPPPVEDKPVSKDDDESEKDGFWDDF